MNSHDDDEDISDMTSFEMGYKSWNPSQKRNQGEIPPTVLMRIKKDLREFYSENMENIHVIPDEADITQVHALITGPKDTPYQYGFFYFFLRFESDYPMHPPKVRLMTTSRNVRFNPNLYESGKVCLSILGTWSGPPWSPALNLCTVLLSIQSLMNEEPYHNEPGYEKTATRFKKDKESSSKLCQQSENYNEVIRHETIRVAVLDMITGNCAGARSMPAELREVMKKLFVKYYPHYEKIVKEKLDLTTKKMNDPFAFGTRGVFDYKTLLKRLEQLKEEYKIAEKTSETATAMATEVQSYSTVKSEYCRPPTPPLNEKEIDLQALIDEADYYTGMDDENGLDYEEEDEENGIEYEEDDADVIIDEEVITIDDDDNTAK